MSTQTELVIGVDFLTLPSRDLEASARFYGEVLGLERSAVWQREGQPPLGMEFETGTVTIALIDPTAVGQEFARHGFPVALRVPDVQAAREQLEAAGGDLLRRDDGHRRLPHDPLRRPRRQRADAAQTVRAEAVTARPS